MYVVCLFGIPVKYTIEIRMCIVNLRYVLWNLCYMLISFNWEVHFDVNVHCGTYVTCHSPSIGMCIVIFICISRIAAGKNSVVVSTVVAT